MKNGDGITEMELKQWLRENLRIDIELCTPHGSGNSVRIGLKFVGEHEPFAQEHVYIPEDDN